MNYLIEIYSPILLARKNSFILEHFLKIWILFKGLIKYLKKNFINHNKKFL